MKHLHRFLFVVFVLTTGYIVQTKQILFLLIALQTTQSYSAILNDTVFDYSTRFLSSQIIRIFVDAKIQSIEI